MSQKLSDLNPGKEWDSFWGNMSQAEAEASLEQCAEEAEETEYPEPRSPLSVKVGNEIFSEHIAAALELVDQSSKSSVSFFHNSILLSAEALIVTPLKDKHERDLCECCEES